MVDLPRAYGVHITPTKKKGYESGDTGTDEYWALQGLDLKAALSRVFSTAVAPFPESRIELPSSFDPTARYDFLLVFAPYERKADRNRLMQQGIERRFQVKLSLEPRPMDVYVLTAPNGQSPAIRDAEGDFGGGGVSFGTLSFSLPAFDDVPPTEESFRARFPTQESWRKAMVSPPSIAGISVSNGAMEAFCRALEEGLDRPVVDETGLSGTYDIELRGDPASDDSIFDRLRNELGLELTAGRREVPVLVVRRNGS